MKLNSLNQPTCLLPLTIFLVLPCYRPLLCLTGEDGSSCHGSVMLGQFEGTIHTQSGTYHIEPLHRYDSLTDHHSIIYHEEDLGKADFIQGEIVYRCFRFQMALQRLSLSIQDWSMCVWRENVSRRFANDGKVRIEKLFAALNVIYDLLHSSLSHWKRNKQTKTHFPTLREIF